IKKAYYKKVWELHPDRRGDKGTERSSSSVTDKGQEGNEGKAKEEFIRVVGAYEVLVDPVRRKEYDAWVAARRGYGASSASSYYAYSAYPHTGSSSWPPHPAYASPSSTPRPMPAHLKLAIAVVCAGILYVNFTRVRYWSEMASMQHQRADYHPRYGGGGAQGVEGSSHDQGMRKEEWEARRRREVMARRAAMWSRRRSVGKQDRENGEGEGKGDSGESVGTKEETSAGG
ncbi:hypothetical protein HK104_005058, partial [Borealophlyctis nickersoniae]